MTEKERERERGMEGVYNVESDRLATGAQLRGAKKYKKRTAKATTATTTTTAVHNENILNTCISSYDFYMRATACVCRVFVCVCVVCRVCENVSFCCLDERICCFAATVTHRTHMQMCGESNGMMVWWVVVKRERGSLRWQRRGRRLNRSADVLQETNTRTQ